MQRINYVGNQDSLLIRTKKNRAAIRLEKLVENVIKITMMPDTNINIAIHFDGLSRLINKHDGNVPNI